MKVRDELYDSKDELKDWCENNLPDNFFKDSSLKITEYLKVSGWALSKKSHYLTNALNEFLNADEADAFIIAYGLSDTANYIIVNQEVSQPDRKNKIKIPEPCISLGVNYLNTIEMFRKLGATF